MDTNQFFVRDFIRINLIVCTLTIPKIHHFGLRNKNVIETVTTVDVRVLQNRTYNRIFKGLRTGPYSPE